MTLMESPEINEIVTESQRCSNCDEKIEAWGTSHTQAKINLKAIVERHKCPEPESEP